MHRDGCAHRIKTRLEREPGVRAVSVWFSDRVARTEYNQHAVGKDYLVEVINKSDFRVASRLP